MKMRKVLLVGMVVFGVLGFGVAGAMAAWYTCTVNMVGPAANGYVYAFLTDTAATPAFTNRYFYFHPSYEKEMLATALTAQANNLKLYVDLSSTAASSVVNSMYLKP